MTTTLIPGSPATREISSADALLGLVHDALSVAAADTGDSFGSRTATGRALLSLAGVARQAAGALGADAGVPVTSGPGVVVVREFAAAVQLLDRAVSRHAGPADVDRFLAPAKGLHAQLHDSLVR